MSSTARQQLIPYFFFAVFLYLLWQVLVILSPFYVALLGSAILASLLYPVHAALLRRMPRRPNAAAALSAAGVVLTVVLPLLILSWMAIKETAKLYPVVQEWVQDRRFLDVDIESMTPWAASTWGRAVDFMDRWNIDPKDILLKNLDQMSRRMTRLAGSVIKNALFFVFNMGVLVFTLFFLLRDGPQLVQWGIDLVPMSTRNKHAVLDRLKVTFYAVIRGVLIVAVVQGFLSGLGFAFLDVPFAILLGILSAFLAPIPFVGPAGIWVPVAIGLALSGNLRSAAYLVLWGVIVVGLVDNFLRPLLISADAKLPLLLLFFGMLGGLQAYGFAGLLIGPILIAMLMTFINIYRREYRWAPEEA